MFFIPNFSRDNRIDPWLFLELTAIVDYNKKTADQTASFGMDLDPEARK